MSKILDYLSILFVTTLVGLTAIAAIIKIVQDPGPYLKVFGLFAFLVGYALAFYRVGEIFYNSKKEMSERQGQ